MLKRRRERIEEQEQFVGTAIVDPALDRNGEAPPPVGTLLLSSGAIDAGALSEGLLTVAIADPHDRRLPDVLAAICAGESDLRRGNKLFSRRPAANVDTL